MGHGFPDHVVFFGVILAEDYLSGKDLTFWNTLLTIMKEKLQNRKT